MRQQVLEFVLEASTAPQVSLDRRVVEDVVRHMAAVIVAVYEEGADKTDDKSSSEQQDQE